MFGSKHVQQQIQDIQDRAYDLFGEFILEKEATKLLSEIESEGEAWTESEEFVARCDARCLKIIEKRSRKARIRQLFMQTVPCLGRVAAIMVTVIALAGCTAFATSETARVRLLQMLVQTTDDYTILSLVPSETDYVDVPGEWQGSYYPTFIPEGLEVIAAEEDTVYYSYGASRPLLIFGEYDEGSVIQIDTDKAETSQTVLHGQIAYVSVKGTTINIYWSESTRFFVLTLRGMPEQIAMNVAESVKQINKN